MDRPVTGLWELVDPSAAERRKVQIRADPGREGGLIGALDAGGEEIFTLVPKSEGLGYQGDLGKLFTPCGLDHVTITDFVPLGDHLLMKLDSRAPVVACPFLENRQTGRWYIAPTPTPVRLRAIGEISTEKAREQIGLGSQPGGTPTPRTADTVLVESGTELNFVGRMRSLDGEIWIEVEGRVVSAPGVEPPRGYLLPDQLRVAASLTLTRAQTDPRTPAR
jgi:hypothetical protein